MIIRNRRELVFSGQTGNLCSSAWPMEIAIAIVIAIVFQGRALAQNGGIQSMTPRMMGPEDKEGFQVDAQSTVYDATLGSSITITVNVSGSAAL